MKIGQDEYEFKHQDEFAAEVVLTVEIVQVLKRRLTKGEEAIRAVSMFLSRRPRYEPAWSHLKETTITNYKSVWEHSFINRYNVADLKRMVDAARCLNMPRVVHALMVAMVYKIHAEPPMTTMDVVMKADTSFGIQPATHFARP